MPACFALKKGYKGSCKGSCKAARISSLSTGSSKLRRNGEVTVHFRTMPGFHLKAWASFGLESIDLDLDVLWIIQEGQDVCKTPYKFEPAPVPATQMR